MVTLREALAAHRAALEDGLPHRGPPVLIEAARDAERLLPKPGDDAASRFVTQRIERGDLDQAAAERQEQLLVLKDEVSLESQVFALVKAGTNPSPNIMIGRARKADVVLADPTISSVHAFIQVVGDRMLLTDHKSRNGTFVNQRRVGPTDEVHLQSGDCVRFGNRILYFLSGDRMVLFLELLLEDRG